MDIKVVQRHGRIPGLDGIRGIAIALVLFAHSVIYDDFSSLRPMGLIAGSAGVSIFFVLSGYLITTLLLREEERLGKISLRFFYLRRALRLFPALWLYLVIVSVIWLVNDPSTYPKLDFAASLLYCRNLVGRGHETGHLWSLSIEEQFYLVWPVILIVSPWRHRIRLIIAIGLLISISIWRICAANLGLVTVGALYMRTDFRFDAPLFGCILALAQQNYVLGSNKSLAKSDGMMVIGLVSLAAWVGMRLSELVWAGTDSTVISLLGVVLIFSQTGVQGRLSRWLAWQPLVTIGQISYGLYLWQQLFLGPRTTGFNDFKIVRTFPFGLAVTFIVALASYWCVERPLLQLKDRRYHRQENEEAGN